MEMMNRAIEDATDFRGMMGKIEADAAQRANMARMQAAMRCELDRDVSAQGSQPPLGLERQPGENRAEHRARLKRERRAKVPA